MILIAMFDVEKTFGNCGRNFLVVVQIKWTCLEEGPLPFTYLVFLLPVELTCSVVLIAVAAVVVLFVVVIDEDDNGDDSLTDSIPILFKISLYTSDQWLSRKCLGFHNQLGLLQRLPLRLNNYQVHSFHV